MDLQIFSRSNKQTLDIVSWNNYIKSVWVISFILWSVLNTYDRLCTDMLNGALSTQNTKLVVFWKNAAPCLCAAGLLFLSFVSTQWVLLAQRMKCTSISFSSQKSLRNLSMTQRVSAQYLYKKALLAAWLNVLEIM